MQNATLTKRAPARASLLRSPDLTVARLTLASYLRSGWMWGEFALVIACFAILYFPYTTKAASFNGLSQFSLGAIAVLGPTVMVRQATSARTYLLLARLTSRAAYSRGLMLAAAALRIPLYLLFLILVLVAQRLNDPTPAALFWGAIGILANTILIACLTVSLCTPIATRLTRIWFLAWLALMLFSFRPLIALPDWLGAVLSLSQLPIWPLGECYTFSVAGSFEPLDLIGLLLIAVYCVLIAWAAGAALERRELILH